MITENETSYYGGGVYCVDSTVRLAYCTITDNLGNGVHCDNHSSSIVTHCIIDNNSANGIYSHNNSSQTLTNCIITNNSDSGIRSSDSSITAIHCTLVGNSCGGVTYKSSSLSISNSILFNEGSEIRGFDNVSLTHCCVQGGWEGEGNISGRPLFVDPENKNYRLQNGSPCIDRGFISAALNDDIEGNLRPGIDGLVDIGAYESPGEYEPGESAPMLFYVRKDAPSGGDGRTWDSALNSVQAALSKTLIFDEIWVARGTYYETIQLEPQVSVYGGFLGSENNREERDWIANPTVIDASRASNTVGADYIRSTTLDGFMITGGSGYGVHCIESFSPTLSHCTITGNSSGGVYCIGYSNPTLEDCLIIDNSNHGIYCSVSSNPTFTRCVIAGHSASEGGGIYCDDSLPILTDCTISGNSANNGGGIYCANLSSPMITNCTINQNSTSYSGSIHCHKSFPTLTSCMIRNNSGSGLYCYDSSLALIHCMITDCTASDDGGGIYCIGDSFLRLTECDISNNRASDDGGGIYCDDSSLILTDCTINNNSDGVYCEGLSSISLIGCEIIYNSGNGIKPRNSSTRITDSLIAYNSGTGIYSQCNNLIVERCQIINNSLYGADISYSGNVRQECRNLSHSHWGYSTLHRGCGYSSILFKNCIIALNSGGVFCDNASSQFLNCTIAGNDECGVHLLKSTYEVYYTDYETGICYCRSPKFANSIIYNNGSSIEVCWWVFGYEYEYCDDVNEDIEFVNTCIQGRWYGQTISANPRFVDPEHGDFRLQPDSPCIDTGNNGALDGIMFDMEGNARIGDGDGDGVATVDMGAYEYYQMQTATSTMTPTATATFTITPTPTITYTPTLTPTPTLPPGHPRVWVMDGMGQVYKLEK